MGRGRPEKLSDHDFLELYADGLMDIEIAEIMGVGTSTVWDRRKKLGLPKNPCNRRTAKVFSVYDGKTGEYIMEGTVREITQRLNILDTTVRSYVVRTGREMSGKYKIYEVEKGA